MHGQKDFPVAGRDAAGAQRGSAFVMAIVILTLLVTVGIALLFLADSDARMNQANVRDKRAFYVAEAGLEDAREQLRTANAASANPLNFSLQLAAAAGPNGAINFNAASLAATYDTNGNVTGFTGYGDDVPLRVMTSFGGGKYAAFLTNDVLEGETNKTDANQRATITAIGTGPNRSVKVVQAIVEKVSIPTPPAFITLLGPAGTPAFPNFDGGSANAKSLTGNDCQGAGGFTGVPGYSVPVVGAFGAAATTQAQAGVYKGSWTSGSDTGTATVHDVSGTASALWNNCTYLHQLADSVRGAADAVCTNASPCSSSYWASTTNNSVTFVDGDWDAHNDGGTGLVWVTGTASFTGTFGFTGTMMVIGKGRTTASGGGSGSTIGAMIVANIAGPDGIYGTADDCSGGFLAPSVSISPGGSHNYIYCGQAVNISLGKLQDKVAQFRQF